MDRRQFLALSVSGLSVAVAGCTQEPSADGDETATPTPGDGGPGCWPSMCAGTELIEVDVAPGFSGAAVLETGCRDDAVSIGPGESVRIVREADGEECGVTLFIDDEPVYDERIGGHVSVAVTVSPVGEVTEERVVL